jgi:hypothetical protein
MPTLKERISKLEQEKIRPEPVHIIMKSYCGQSDTEAFDEYQVKRSAQGFEPKEGWQKLKERFLSPETSHKKQIDFIKYEVVASASPTPPVITNAQG